MNTLRLIMPVQIVRGALLRTDGVAIGLVSGGAPSWDLLATEGKAQVSADYHNLLTALDAPIDIYQIDDPPDVDGEIATLIARQEQTAHPTLNAVLNEMADYLSVLAQHGGSRAKQVIWAVTANTDGGARTRDGLDLVGLVQGGSSTKASASTNAHRSALHQAVERARRLADAVSVLGGTPAPRLMEAEEIAHLVYQLVDPIRAQRYPLAGSMLDRVRRVVTLGNIAT